MYWAVPASSAGFADPGLKLALQKGICWFSRACSFALHIICVGRYAKSLEPAHRYDPDLVVGLWRVYRSERKARSLHHNCILPWFHGNFSHITGHPRQNSVQRFTTPAVQRLFCHRAGFAALTVYYGGEELTGQALLGAVLVFAGILLAELKGGRKIQRQYSTVWSVFTLKPCPQQLPRPITRVLPIAASAV